MAQKSIYYHLIFLHSQLTVYSNFYLRATAINRLDIVMSTVGFPTMYLTPKQTLTWSQHCINSHNNVSSVDLRALSPYYILYRHATIYATGDALMIIRVIGTQRYCMHSCVTEMIQLCLDKISEQSYNNISSLNLCSCSIVR